MIRVMGLSLGWGSSAALLGSSQTPPKHIIEGQGAARRISAGEEIKFSLTNTGMESWWHLHLLRALQPLLCCDGTTHPQIPTLSSISHTSTPSGSQEKLASSPEDGEEAKSQTAEENAALRGAIPTCLRAWLVLKKSLHSLG